MFDLAGKVALVVGGAGYLGTPVCRGLVRQGAALVVADVDPQRAAVTAAEIKALYPGALANGALVDVGDEQSVKNTIGDTLRTHGRLDIVVNCAFHSVGGSVHHLSADKFDFAMHINLTGAFVLAREASNAMEEGGSIVIFSSMYGLVSPDPKLYEPPMDPNPIEYGMAKAALIQMVRYLSVHWGPRGIRVNAVAPGPFPAPNVQRDHPDFARRLAEKVPLGRIGRQDEVAGAVVFLASDEASFVTGHTLVVDGGWTAL